MQTSDVMYSTPSYLIPVQRYTRLMLISLVCMMSYPATAEKTDKKVIEGTTGYSQERFRKPPPYTGPTRTGEQVYEYACKTCHARSTQGAPLPDDYYEWSLRLRQGMDVLMEHTLNGYKELMPVRGGCFNCSDAEVKAGVIYMLEMSGAMIKPGL